MRELLKNGRILKEKSIEKNKWQIKPPDSQSRRFVLFKDTLTYNIKNNSH